MFRALLPRSSLHRAAVCITALWHWSTRLPVPFPLLPLAFVARIGVGVSQTPYTVNCGTLQPLSKDGTRMTGFEVDLKRSTRNALVFGSEARYVNVASRIIIDVM